MVIYEIFQRQNLIQIYIKTNQIALFKKKNSRNGRHASDPSNKAHANFEI